MAFDQPLESDKPSEDNLLVSLVRGPILGSLMWILGDDDGEEKMRDVQLQQGLQDMVLDDDDPDSDKPQKSLPRLVRSDLSAAMEMEQQQQENSHNALSRASCSSDQSIGNNKQRIEKKKMSWSENLVEYMDESIRHEPPTASHGNPTALSKPIKSAMTRSTSVRSHPLIASGGSDQGGSQEERKIRYIPNFDRAHHSGLIMPTRPVGMGVGGDPHGGGIESPQWGWYINTTPPTPEMYHSRSSLHKRDSSKSDHSTASSTATDVIDPAAIARGPNRIFQGFKAGSNRPPVGWPSVPL